MAERQNLNSNASFVGLTGKSPLEAVSRKAAVANGVADFSKAPQFQPFSLAKRDPETCHWLSPLRAGVGTVDNACVRDCRLCSVTVSIADVLD